MSLENKDITYYFASILLHFNMVDGFKRCTSVSAGR